ncbi:disintegrin and metalloproteinase domain-containing protein 10-like isoform X2 [Ornithodoros turicata]|uniref:disintegrin and metalloproteinase domain-containing protein 10-like isoform X2 n=1 Tax=Ornithodoros turicata TaxID=34597 RepID=UPI0031393812
MHCQSVFLAVLLSLVIPSVAQNDEPLKKMLRYYERIFYEPVRSRPTHWRRKRSLDANKGRLFLTFKAYNRHFHLSLKNDRSTFSDDFVLETASEGRVQPKLDHIYSGYLVGEPNSRVFGYMLDGIFHGRITTPTQEYYLERANTYIKNSGKFHSIIYTASDVIMPEGGCGLYGTTKEWMDRILRRYARKDPARQKRPKRWLREAVTLVEEANENLTSNQRHKRPRAVVSPNVKRVCNVEVTIDHTLYNIFYRDIEDPLRVRDALSGLVSSHIAAASEIFSNTNFYGITDIAFDAQRIIINDTAACEGQRKARNPFCSSHLDAAHMLHEFSKSRHDDFCVAYVWTYRDFPNGVLGLAYVAEPSGNSGGLCVGYYTGIGTDFPSDYAGPLSLNTGVVTFMNQNNHLIGRVSQLTFTHELGHHFGAQHDEGECAPEGDVGNFIMYPSATMGDKPNNKKFSPCSIKAISAVIHPLLAGEGSRTNCLQEPRGPFCGNSIRETGEECDCGYETSDCKDKCCYPREHHEVNRKGCTLTPNSKCSPSNSRCCNGDCQLYNSTQMCRVEDDCTWESYCDGTTDKCPPNQPKDNGTLCNKGTQICVAGECRLSVCKKYGFKECYLSGSHYSLEDMCLIACQENDDDAECKPACSFEVMKDLCGRRMEPGAPCDHLRGYCDVFHKCRRIDSNSPLANLQRLIFGRHGLPNLLVVYWYITLPGVMCCIALMVVFIRLCAVHTPSSNPHLPRNRKFAQSIKQPVAVLKEAVSISS